jgi:hypothetical protein
MDMNTNAFRQPGFSERKLVEKLLSEDFPGRGELQQQWLTTLVKPIGDSFDLDLQVMGGPMAQVIDSVPVIGEVEDSDGALLQVQLHVREGLLSSLEIVKPGFAEVLSFPDATTLRALPSIGGFWPPKGFLLMDKAPEGYSIKGGKWSPTHPTGEADEMSLWLVLPGGRVGDEGYIIIDERRFTLDAADNSGTSSPHITSEGKMNHLRWLVDGIEIEITSDEPSNVLLALAARMTLKS